MPDRIRKIHAYHAFGEALQAGFSERFPDRELVVWDDEEDFARGIENVEVLLALRPPRGHWQRARRLRLVQMPGAGVDSLLPEPDRPESVRIANARGEGKSVLDAGEAGAMERTLDVDRDGFARSELDPGERDDPRLADRNVHHRRASDRLSVTIGGDHVEQLDRVVVALHELEA